MFGIVIHSLRYKFNIFGKHKKNPYKIAYKIA